MVNTTVAAAPLIEEEDEEDCLTQYYFGKPNGSCTRDILKSKENILKLKLHRNLKKKLKKYKLKKDGTEDPEILDVSQTFNRTLTFRSPNKSTKGNQLNGDTEKRENYLIKMVRRKQSLLSLKKEEVSKSTSKPMVTGHRDSEDRKSDADDGSKKQTNAFTLLMDSRNKSIGSNSPGKDRSLNESETEDINEKKKRKAKRNLLLQKMAEDKGALKKKELQEIEEACIKDKMQKRAERLKKMFKGNETQKKKSKLNKKVGNSEENENICKTSNNKISEKVCNRNNTDGKAEDGLPREKRNAFARTEHKRILKEDQEFLSKLSPSLKKKENMLCYFRKVHKESEVIALAVEVQCQAEENQEMEIRVKPVPKAKNKSKYRKLSLNKINEKDVDCNENNTTKTKGTKPAEKNITLSISDDTKCRKRKRRPSTDSSLKDTPETSTINITSKAEQLSEGRPKRNIKKPVKYNDAHLSSSDEELHVFTPKKKKPTSINNTPTENHKNPRLLKMNGTNELENEVVIVASKNKNEKFKPPTIKNVTKLAPIFKKTQIDPAALEAKQRFLQSGIPEQLKKVISQQSVQDVATEFFYPVVHVHQNKQTTKVLLNEIVEFDDSDNDCQLSNLMGLATYGENDLKNLLQINETNERILVPSADIDVKETLKNIKESYPQFPVYRTYKTLCSKKNGDHKDLNCTDLDNSSEVLNGAVEMKKENSDQLTWCTKYRATSTNQILGNFDSIQELRKWLITWTNNDACVKHNDDSDSDFDEYDTDSRDSLRISNNLLTLTGPVGSGKTSSVYAVAAELAIKVIEVNVSSKRTGKILLQDLQEATQSHKVNRGKGSSAENSQEFIKSKKKLQKTKRKYKGVSNGVVPLDKSESQSQSQEDGRTGMSLILIDDADLVFDQDDGFVSAIAQLIQCSKRPVILVVTSLNCQHLKFLLSGTILKMNSLSPRILGTWLDVMCLVDTKLCWPGIGETFLDYYSGDIRKAINCLHFLLASETQKCTEDNTTILEEQNIIGEIQDENSNCSWADHDQIQDKEELNSKLGSQNLVGYHLISSTLRTTLNDPLDLFYTWWSLPTILKLTNDVNVKEIKESNRDCLKNLESISNTLVSISLADCFSYKIKPDSRLNISSNPWICEETDSVSERENFDDVNNAFEVIKEMSQGLVASTLNIARKTFRTENSDVRFPGLAEQRNREKIINRHDALTNAINPTSVLDRKALALDYWPTCRSICRTEKKKTGDNSKRHKRFTHYLKSSMINKNIFDKLCDSLSTSTADEGE